MSREESVLWSRLGFSLLKLYGKLQREEKALAARYQLGASHVEMLSALSHLEEKPGEWIPVQAVYPFFALTQPAIGRILRHLEYWGFVHMCRDKSDRRRLLVRLDPKAHKLLEEIELHRAHILRSAFPDVSPKQLRSWVQALRSLNFAVHRHVEASMGLSG